MTDATNAPAAAGADDDRARLWAEFDKDAPVSAETASAAADVDDDRDEAEPAPNSTDTGKGEQPDPWASAPEELRAQYEAALRKAQKAEEAEHRANSLQGRVQAYEARLRELEKGPKPSPVQAPAASGARDGDSVSGMSDDQWSRLREEYPEIADAIAGELRKQAEASNRTIGEMRAVMQRLETDFDARQRAEQEAIRSRMIDAEQRLNAEFGGDWGAHIGLGPDGRLADPQRYAAWKAWAEDQPKRIRDAIAANERGVTDPDTVAPILRSFTQFLGAEAGTAPQGASDPLAERRRRMMAGAAQPRGTRGSAPMSGPPPADAPREAIWDWFDRIEKR